PKVPEAHHTASVDEHGGRHAAKPVALPNLALLVEETWKPQLPVPHKRTHVPHPLLIGQIDRQHFEACHMLRIVRRDDVAHLTTARFAPCRPEIEKDRVDRKS